MYDTRDIDSSVTIGVDNQGTIALAKNQPYTSTEHIDVRYHFLREVVSDGVVKLLCTDQ